MFHLLTGPYRDLEEAFLEDLRAQKKDDALANILVLSPSAHLLDHLQRRLSEGAGEREREGLQSSLAPTLTPSRARSFLNVHFLTFYALAERLLADADFNDRVVTESAVYREIVNDFLTQRGDIPFTSRDA